MLKKTALFIGLFLVICTYFIFGSGWYEPAELFIRGTADKNGSITVQWDSGGGLNRYERRMFSFLPFQGDPEKKIPITISGGAERNKLSRGSRIILNEIRIDNRGVPIPPSALTNVRHVKGKGWYFDTHDSEINLDLAVTQRLFFSFKTSDRFGIARIAIDEANSSHDLYRRNWEILFSELNFWVLDETNHFTVSFQMPRYAIEQLVVSGSNNVSFSSVELGEKSGRTGLDYDQLDANAISVVNPNERLKRYFHPLHLMLQVLFALLVTSILFAVGGGVSDRGGMKQLLISYKSTWIFFLGACIVYGLWLMAFWPGVMSVDSLNIWRSALLPEVLINNHPYVNELWYFFLSLIWNHIAIVPIIQIILLSLLIGCTLGFIARRGVSWLVIIPIYIFFLISVPIGLYNTTLWKDVPFALLVILWALTASYWYLKKRNGEQIKISIVTGLLLLLSFWCLITIRHNGLVYLFVIPFLFLILRLVRVPKSIFVLGCIAIPVFFYIIVFPPAQIKRASYFHDLSQTYIQQLGKESLTRRVSESVAKYPRLLDIKKNQEDSDFWHYYLKDRYAYRFLREVGWSDIFSYLDPEKRPFSELRKMALKIYPASLEYPWLYMSWYPFPLLYLFPISILLFRWFPLSAIFSTVVITQVAALLLFVGTTNWRYYYFVLLGGYFLLPVILFDLKILRQRLREV